MKKLLHFALSAVALGTGLAPAQDPLPPAAPPYFRVRYEPSAQPGELVFGVTYTAWIPPGVRELRGVIVHQHGCGEGACKAGQTAAFDLHWQALARQHGCALLGPSYEQPEKAECALWWNPQNGSEKKFLQALNDLAAQSKHPELASVPWALWGHSGGANWVGTMLLLHPERTVAVWLRSGSPRLLSQNGRAPALEIPSTAYAVPVMCNLGTKEGVTVKDGRFAGMWPGVEKFFTEFRAQGGLIGFAIDPLTAHECGNQRYLAIPWLDACLTARLPEKSGDPLKPMPAESAWLAPLPGDAAQPAASFAGDAAKAVWLPNEHLAKAWAEYVKDTAVADATPPPAPANVRLKARGELTWDADADLESGLAGFILERDGVEIARLPEKPAGPFGRPIFQKNSYSDTPTQPLAAMRFTDPAPKPGAKYRITTLNTAGLPSTPSGEVVAEVSAGMPTPGERPPPEIAAKVKPALEEGRRALAAQDAAAMRAAVAKAIAALGPWAGNPQTATRYFPPADRAAYDLAKARAWWRGEIERGLRGLPWRKNPDGDPRTMVAGLREAAWPLDGLARTAHLFPEKREEITQHVRAGADWLVKLQHASGVFPFPIGPGLKPRDKVGHIVARAIAEHPEIVVNDWIPDDGDDGGLQFDNGLCGRALVSAWELTKDPRYLEAARKSGEWAIARPLVPNWNYTAFSVGLLARLATATGEAKYLEAAVKKADIGVLPGQLPGGRWFDAHNACAVYHNILLRELLELLRALPAGHDFRATLLDAITRGLNQAADETLANGFTGTWTDNFARGLQWIGENKKWRDALHVNLNGTGKNGAPTPGFAIVAVLEGIPQTP